MSPAARARLAPARRSCGGLEVRLEGEPCVLRVSGALWAPGPGLLVAADLHLEKGSAFAVRGQMLPPYDSRATLARLEAEITALDPACVVLLGDSFHDRGAIARLDADDLSRLARLARDRDWVWLEGNHDREALAADLGADLGRLPGRIAGDMAVGPLRLTHEPTPGQSANQATGQVAGHLHPCAAVAAHGRRVRRPCFVTDGRRLVMPAFGAFTGGLSVRDPAFADLFEAPPLVVALGRDKAHALDWGQVR